MSPVAGLSRFVGRAAAEQPAAARTARQAERCELCGQEVGVEHSHVVNVETRGLLCACRPCYLLFTHDGAGSYRAVPERYLADADAELSEGDWDSLQVPVAMAYFFHNSTLGRIVAQYPSPAGATESLLDLAAWQTVAARYPLAAALAPDVEALIVRRSREGNEAYLVPIDACYELVGRMRLHWTGFDGGAEARQDIADFFDRVRARSRPLRASQSGPPGVDRG